MGWVPWVPLANTYWLTNIVVINRFEKGCEKTVLFFRFGSPYTIQVSRETLYGDLQKLLMKEMSGILHDDILISQQKVPLFKIRVLDGLDEPEESSSQHTKTSSAAATKSSSSGGSGAYLDSSVDMPMYTLAIEQAINISSVTGKL